MTIPGRPVRTEDPQAGAAVTAARAARARARWALRDDRKLPAYARLVWLMLDTRGDDPHPSNATLADDCGIHRKTLRAAIRRLEEDGWLRVVPRTTPEGDSDTNRYDLICPAHEGVGALVTPPPSDQAQHVSPAHGGGGASGAGGGRAGDPTVGALVTPEVQQGVQQEVPGAAARQRGSSDRNGRAREDPGAGAPAGPAGPAARDNHHAPRRAEPAPPLIDCEACNRVHPDGQGDCGARVDPDSLPWYPACCGGSTGHALDCRHRTARRPATG